MSKYKAKKVIIDNIEFDSKLESKYYLELKKLKKEGKINDFELQPEYILQPKFKKNGKNFREIKYIADFKVIHMNSSVQIIDVKGMETADFKLKKKLFEYKFPELELIILKYVKKFGGWITSEEYTKKKREEKKGDKK